VDKKVRVKFIGGREVVGFLKGADPTCNMVLDETIEFLRGKLLERHFCR
jgi:U6 snRNA-associated Sm-like protein LSm7